MLRSIAALTLAATLVLPLTAPASAQPGHDQQRQDFHPGNRGGDNRGGFNRGGDNRGGFNRGGDNRGDFHQGYDRRGGAGGDGIGGLLLGLGLGAVVGGAIAPAFQAPPPVYYGAPATPYAAPPAYYPPPPAYYPPPQQYGY